MRLQNLVQNLVPSLGLGMLIIAALPLVILNTVGTWTFVKSRKT